MARPISRVTFKYKKDAGDGWENDLEIAVWPPNDGAPERVLGNVKFPKGALIKLADGRTFPLDNFWVALEKSRDSEDAGF